MLLNVYHSRHSWDSGKLKKTSRGESEGSGKSPEDYSYQGVSGW